MTKPMVERYEQILAQDPASTVFVELAKALLEKGEHQRAIEVCQSGLEYHKGSVVGRVLWGKALINLGRPAEAMEQFDQAIAIDRNNPHAYNLIGEVLLHKGLYRSALPLLRKAVALQPNDGRVRQWLAQTQQALAGGPAPVLSDPTVVDGADPNARLTDPSARALEASEPTEVNVPAFVPSEEPAPKNGSSGEHPAAPEQDDPFSAVAPPSEAESPETIRGMTNTWDALAGDPGVDEPIAPQPPPPPPAALFDNPISEQTIIPAQDLYLDGKIERSPRPKPPAPGGLLDDIPPPAVDEDEVITGVEVEATAPPAPAPQPQPQPQPQPGSGLLDDVPDFVPSTVDVPKVELTRQATEAIAKEYERELRQKLEAASAHKTFLQRHGLKLALGAVLGVAALAFGGFFLWTQIRNRNVDLPEALANARRLVNEDTRESYGKALEYLGQAVEMSSDNEEAWILTAYVRSVLFSEHGANPADRAKALEALSRPGLREKYPAVALAVDYHLAEAGQKEAAQKAILESDLDQSEVHELSGRILLAQKKADKGVKRLLQAVEVTPTYVRALVALGNHYLALTDYEQALKLYSGAAAQLSPRHPERAIGAAEARLALGRDLAEALEEVKAVPQGDALSPSVMPRRELALGRLLSAAGEHEKAFEVLEKGVKAFPNQAFDFQLALGEAARAAGDMEAAEKAFEAALASRPKSDDAKEALGRVLLASGRERELLIKLQGDGSRKVHLVRGIAYSRLGDWKKARQELARTQVNNKFPAEAVIHLALVDAAEGRPERAQAVLEKALASSKKAKGELRVALGQVYWQRGILDKAKAQFEEAAKDPTDYEGACSLGRLLLQLGLADVAVGALTKAVERNKGHAEARLALVRAHLSQGKLEEAVKQGEAWQIAQPAAAAAHRELALSLYHSGRAKDADEPSAKAVKLDGSDAEAARVRAMVLFALGDTKQAFASLERANKLNPKDAETFCEIGHAFLRVGNRETGQKAYEAARREDPKSVCGAVGLHYAKLPAGGKAVAKELEELLGTAARAHDKAFVKATQARALLAGGSVKDARKAADEAVALAPALGLAHLSLGLVAAKQKEPEAAIEALTRAAELDPGHGGVRLALGDLLSKSDPARAVEEYERFLAIGGSDAELSRAKKSLTNLKKKLGQR